MPEVLEGEANASSDGAEIASRAADEHCLRYVGCIRESVSERQGLVHYSLDGVYGGGDFTEVYVARVRRCRVATIPPSPFARRRFLTVFFLASCTFA